MRRERESKGGIEEGLSFFFNFFFSYLSAFSVWNTDEEIERQPTTGHDKQMRDLSRK